MQSITHHGHNVTVEDVWTDGAGVRFAAIHCPTCGRDFITPASSLTPIDAPRNVCDCNGVQPCRHCDGGVFNSEIEF